MRREEGREQITFGIILLVIGGLITALTYSMASANGGMYIVSYGPMVIGVIRIIQGLSRRYG